MNDMIIVSLVGLVIGVGASATERITCANFEVRAQDGHSHRNGDEMHDGYVYGACTTEDGSTVYIEDLSLAGSYPHLSSVTFDAEDVPFDPDDYEGHFLPSWRRFGQPVKRPVRTISVATRPEHRRQLTSNVGSVAAIRVLTVKPVYDGGDQFVYQGGQSYELADWEAATFNDTNTGQLSVRTERAPAPASAPFPALIAPLVRPPGSRVPRPRLGPQGLLGGVVRENLVQPLGQPLPIYHHGQVDEEC